MNRYFRLGVILFSIAGAQPSCNHRNEALQLEEVAEPLAVKTYRNGGTGLYTDTYLQPSTVRYDNFGKLWEYDVNGFVYAQPLTLDNVSGIPGVTGTRNVLYVATNSNTLYAFDADKPGPPLWQRGFGPPMDGTITCPPPDDPACLSYNTFPYPNHYKFGILGTPAINGTTLYLVALTDPDATFNNPHTVTHTLYAINGATGAILQSRVISGSAPSNVPGSPITFNSFYQNQRPGLLYQNGKVYVAFGSHTDAPPYYGWVFSFDGATLAPAATFCTTCSAVGPGVSGGAGIWQAGAGLVGDGSNIYFTTGNGDWGQHIVYPLANSVVRLNAQLGNPASFHAGDPSLDAGMNDSELTAWDIDLGSSGPLLIPQTPPANSLIVAGGKEGILYLLSNPSTGNALLPIGSPALMTANVYVNACSDQLFPSGPEARPAHPTTCGTCPASPFGRCVPNQPLAWDGLEQYPHIHGTPIYWPGHGLYVWAEKDYLRRYQISGGGFTKNVRNIPTSDVSSAPPAPIIDQGRGMPGGMMAMSVNTNGQGILWAGLRNLIQVPSGIAESYGTGVLRAIDAAAADMPEMWSSDVPFTIPPFTALSISNGKVFVPTVAGKVQVYGKIDRAAAVVAPAANRLDLVVRGLDGSVFHKAFDGTQWQPSATTYESLSGSSVGTPVAVAAGASRLEVFTRGTDNVIRHRFRTGSGSTFPAQSWASLGGSIIAPFTGISWGANRIDLFGEWTDHTVRTISWDGTSWTPAAWKSLGALPGSPILTPVRAVSWGVGRIDLYEMNAGTGEVFSKAWTGTAWAPSDTGWTSLGGNGNKLTGTVSAVVWGTNKIALFARGDASNIYWKYFNGTSWIPSLTTWDSLGATPQQPGGGRQGVADLPRAVSWGADRIDLFSQAADGTIYQKTYLAASGWSAWNQLPGEVIGTPEPVSWGANRIDLFVRSLDSTLVSRATVDGVNWLPATPTWFSLGGTIAF